MTLQLKESRDDLERKVEERTRQLEENIEELNQPRMSTLTMLEDLQSAKRELEMINRELKEMDETKMKFIGIASHELKTPLTAIKANIDFILSEKEGKVPDTFKPYLLTIQRNTNRIQGDHGSDARSEPGSNPADSSSTENRSFFPRWSEDISTRSSLWIRISPSRSTFRKTSSSMRIGIGSTTSSSISSQMPSNLLRMGGRSRSLPAERTKYPPRGSRYGDGYS